MRVLKSGATLNQLEFKVINYQLIKKRIFKKNRCNKTAVVSSTGYIDFYSGDGERERAIPVHSVTIQLLKIRMVAESVNLGTSILHVNGKMTNKST